MIVRAADEKLIAVMANEFRKFMPGMSPHAAWCVCAGLLAGYRLGDAAAAAGMAAIGEEDCRRLVREALEASAMSTVSLAAFPVQG